MKQDQALVEHLGKRKAHLRVPRLLQAVAKWQRGQNVWVEAVRVGEVNMTQNEIPPSSKKQCAHHLPAKL
jgi:hypothetical protein